MKLVEFLIKESGTLTNEFSKNILRDKKPAKIRAQLIKGKKKKKGSQKSSGGERSKVCPRRRLISLITSNYLFQIARCQFETSIIKMKSTTDHYSAL